MTVKLYNNTSPANYVSKTISLVSELTGTLRSPSSIVDPVITIERFSPVGFNYAHIPDFGRYYFLENTVCDANNLVTIRLHVDVLMTYASAISSMQAIIKRQEFSYNTYLDDGIYKAYQDPLHKLLKFPYTFNDFSYILAIAGN